MRKALAALALAVFLLPAVAHAQIKLGVATRAHITTGVGAPFAIAMKMGWFKGKTIGVTNMASAGVIIARPQVAAAGLNPDTDVTIVVAGEGAQPAAMIRNKQVYALKR